MKAMKISGSIRWLMVTVAVVTAILFLGNIDLFQGPKSIDFNTQVKPIINEHCIHCHGGVKRSGGLSFMTREDLLTANESGHPAIVPGRSEESELVKRITSQDPHERMPFEGSPLPKDQVAIFEQWIDEGAPWGIHWAYQPVQEVEVPKLTKKMLSSLGSAPVSQEWISNDIDHFILTTLQQNGLHPSPRADQRTLLRRAGLDLIGLPAPDSLATAFLDNKQHRAYEQLVDQLLASPQFGEKWASMWLDLARYADTKGYERDPRRSIWPYRDWVIQALNADMPYDQFLTEQIDGAQLPNPTTAQYIATGFHRNTSTNDEGGTDNEEFRVAAVLDRVNTTWEVLLGTTFACTQCHGHPYDPFKHEEYYRFMAFFNNSRDEDTAEDYPRLRLFEAEDAAKLERLKSWLLKYTAADRARQIWTFLKTWQPAYYSIATDQFVNAELYDTKHLTFRNGGSARLAGVDLSKVNTLLYRYRSGRDGGQWAIHLDSVDGPIIGRDAVIKTKGKWSFRTLEIEETEGVHDLYFTFYNPTIVEPKGVGLAFDWFHFTQEFPGRDKPGFETHRQLFWDLLSASTAHTLVMMENPKSMRRPTHVFDRGNWLVKKEAVQPKVPEIFEPLPESAPNNRLGLAQWLVDKRNPLTARTMVNRIWEQLFGTGLAETLEDLGSQGVPPTHPKLLDHLAWKFMHDHQWSVKSLIREIVLSATYTQSAAVTEEQLAEDPLNNLYGRMSRVRLSGEQIRDQTLAVSGLLSYKLYGEPVMPYQPEGIWNTPYNNDTWEISEGEDRYRRTIYTFWKRSAPYPLMTTFDATAREVCSARRIRTNTPLQALVTLNDEALIEAARAFAIALTKKYATPTEQIAGGYEKAVHLTITQEKLEILSKLYEDSLRDFQADETAWKEILTGIKSDWQRPEVAALTVVANALFNLDEFITRG